MDFSDERMARERELEPKESDEFDEVSLFIDYLPN